MTDITIAARDGGAFSAYLAAPQGKGNGQALIVIQEIFGVNATMRALCDDYAAEGYLAVCPDLFWRQEPGIQLTDQTEVEWQKAFQLYKGFSQDKGAEDLGATLDFLRAYPRTEGTSGRAKVGCVGFCLGGKLAYLMATRTDCDASVSYYGVGIDQDISEADRIAKPLLLHIAGKDGFVPPEAQQLIVERLTGKAEIYTYPERDHAFARIGGAHYHEADAKRAHERSAAFLKAHLG
jgi:carboxymethylenebutenolidase